MEESFLESCFIPHANLISDNWAKNLKITGTLEDNVKVTPERSSFSINWRNRNYNRKDRQI